MAEHWPFGVGVVYLEGVECLVVCDVDVSVADAGASESEVWYVCGVSELTCPEDFSVGLVDCVEYSV